MLPARGRQGGEVALAVMVSAQFMVVVDFSIVNVALPTIQHALRFSTVGVEGVITAYGTAFGSTLILGGRLADLYGKRPTFIVGLLTFGATSLLCALATSGALLLIARALQGLAAAVLTPAALGLLTTTFPEGRERNQALAVFGAATAAGFVCGQALGGVLCDTVGWRAIFVINLPVALLAALLISRTIATTELPGVKQRLDIPGAVLITTAMGLLVWAPARGAEHGWDSPAFLIPLLAAAGVLVAFVAVEQRQANPLLRLGMLRSRWFAGTTIATIIAGALNGAAWLLATLFLQHVLGYNSLQAGLAFIAPGVAGYLVATRYAAALITAHGARSVLTSALLISALAIGLLSRLPHHYPELMPALTIIGATFTTATVATTIAISAGVPDHEQAVAQAIRQTAFQTGGALSAAVMLSIAASHTSVLLLERHRPSDLIALTAGYRLALIILATVAALGGLTALTALRPTHTPTATQAKSAPP